MAVDAGTAWVQILPDLSKFGKELNKQVVSAGDDAGPKAGDKAGAGFGARMARTVAGLGLGVSIGAAVGVGVRTAMDNEVAQIKFEQLLGSTTAAKGFITDLQAFAAKTPFDFPGLQDAAGRFLAVGVEAGRVVPIMTTLGDATSMMGTGAAGVDRATTALTQMAQKGKVTGEEMLQLTEAGIPAWDALAASMGLSIPATQDLVSKGLVPADAMFAALESSSGQALSAMAGGMEKMSQTTAGQWSTFKDTAAQALGSVAGVVLPALTSLLGWVNGSLIPGLGAFADTLYRWRVPIMVVAGLLAVLFGPMLVATGVIVVTTLASMAAGWIAMAAAAAVNAVIIAAAWLVAFWPVALVVAAVAAVIAVVWLFWDEIAAALQLAWDWVKQVFTSIGATIMGVFTAVADTLAPLWETLWAVVTLPVRIWWTVVSAVFQLARAAIVAVFTAIAGFVEPIWRGLWDRVRSVVSTLSGWVSGAFGAIRDTITAVFRSVASTVSGIWDGIVGTVQRAISRITGAAQAMWGGIKGVVNAGIGMLNSAIGGFNSLIGAVNRVPGVSVPTIPRIPMLADGGIVTSPTLALIGEAGPEAVVPLDRYRSDTATGTGPVLVRVYIGDTELTDLVRVEVDRSGRQAARALASGRWTA